MKNLKKVAQIHIRPASVTYAKEVKGGVKQYFIAWVDELPNGKTWTSSIKAIDFDNKSRMFKKGDEVEVMGYLNREVYNDIETHVIYITDIRRY